MEHNLPCYQVRGGQECTQIYQIMVRFGGLFIFSTSLMALMGADQASSLHPKMLSPVPSGKQHKIQAHSKKNHPKATKTDPRREQTVIFETML